MNTQEKSKGASIGLQEFVELQNGRGDTQTSGLLVVAGYTGCAVFAALVDAEWHELYDVYSLPASLSNNTCEQIDAAIKWLSSSCALSAAAQIQKRTPSGLKFEVKDRFSVIRSVVESAGLADINKEVNRVLYYRLPGLAHWPEFLFSNQPDWFESLCARCEARCN